MLHVLTICHYKVIAILLTVFSMLYIITLHLSCFITGCLYLLIPYTYFIPPPTFLPSGDHQFVLCIYKSVSFVCFAFWIAFINEIVWYLSFSV